jgi:hypothetical protein
MYEKEYAVQGFQEQFLTAFWLLGAKNYALTAIKRNPFSCN